MRHAITIGILLCFISFSSFAGEQGVNANTSGKKFESRIASILKNYGFHVERHSGYEGGLSSTELAKVDQRVALLQPPYTTLYGSPGRSDFVLAAPELESPVWIETKRMTVSGSLDEKLPHVFLNALAALPGHHVIILLDGGGWREGGLAWIHAAKHDRRWADFANYPNKRVDVMNPTEFEVWLAETFDHR